MTQVCYYVDVEKIPTEEMQYLFIGSIFYYQNMTIVNMI